jgi:hypothetical protein
VRVAVRPTSASARSSARLVDGPTDPAQSVSFIEVPAGSHNMTVHPSGDYLYNSNSDLITSTRPTISIFDIRDPRSPVKVQDYRIPFVPASLGSESHDITFSADGTRAYSAALSQTLSSTRPTRRTRADRADPRPGGAGQPRRRPDHAEEADGTSASCCMISDEQAGAAAGTNCPGGGVHVYDITGRPREGPEEDGRLVHRRDKPSTATCTAHVFRMHGDQGLFTIAWYDQGVRVVDVQGLADLPSRPSRSSSPVTATA